MSKITKVELTAGEKNDGTCFVMTCGTTDYPFRADSAEEAAAWVSIIEKRMRGPNP